MNKFIKTLAATILGLTLVVGVGVGISSQQGLNSENVLAADGTEHEIQSFTGKGVGTVINNNTAPANIELTNLDYPVKQVKINWKHNKSNDGVTATVSVGGTNLGSGKVGGSNTTSDTIIGDGSKSLSGDVTITFSNSMTGTGKGTLYLNKLFLVEGSGSPASNYTVTFDANGHGTAPDPVVVSSGGKVTKPADPTASGFTFGGWYTETGCTNEYDFNTSVTSSFTLFAKWTAEGPTPTPGGYYEKVTSSLDDWTGQYLIVYESSSLAFNGSLTTLDAANNGFSVSISNNQIAANSDTESKYFTIGQDGSYWTIKSASGYYIGAASSNGLSASQTVTDTQRNSISYADGKFTIKGNKGNGSKTLSFNTASDQNRFRYLGTTLIQLYKKQAGAEVPLTDIGLPSTASVQVDSTTTLTPIKTPTNANKNDTLSWESLDPTYASVNQSGVVSGLKEGTARIRVNATDIGKSATCTVTVSPVPPVPVTHTIADCYSVKTGTAVKFNGIYMGTYGTSVRDGIFFADGEWGILVYGYTSSIPSTWEVGKTVVAVSGNTAFYNGLIQIKENLSFQVTSASVDSPVVYTFLGTETTADALSRKSSIAGTITAITGQTNNKFVTSTDGKVTVDLGDGKSATIFIKKGAHTQTELDEYSEKFIVGAYVAVTGFLNYYDKDTSFKGTYNPTKFQIIVPKISAMEKYTAVKFSQDFLTATDPICSSSGDNHLTALQAIWTDLGANYTLLDSAERGNLADTSATDTDIVSAIARYKYICGKYNTETVKNLEEFIEGVVIVYNAPNVFFGVSSTDNNTMMIVIISVAVASISLLGVTIFLKKKRAIH